MSSGPNHPIEGLMHTVMDSLREIVDVNTILGDPVETPDGAVILPVSRVSFGFVAGGTDQPYMGEQGKAAKDTQNSAEARPFGGGSGAGISVSPVAFLVVRQNEVRLMPVDSNAIYDRLLDLAPKLLDQLQGAVTRREYTEKPAWAYDSGGRNNL
ncbi:MAG: sporulation protein YtfJ [Firmicutes bacterium]|jgi:sporulation protein YtfJ|nr:sporulation protein YtfJ [Bacillota bacterium]